MRRFGTALVALGLSGCAGFTAWLNAPQTQGERACGAFADKLDCDALQVVCIPLEANTYRCVFQPAPVDKYGQNFDPPWCRHFESGTVRFLP